MSSSTTMFPFILSTVHNSGDLFNLICLFLTLLIISLCFIIASKQKTNKQTKQNTVLIPLCHLWSASTLNHKT